MKWYTSVWQSLQITILFYCFKKKDPELERWLMGHSPCWISMKAWVWTTEPTKRAECSLTLACNPSAVEDRDRKIAANLAPDSVRLVKGIRGVVEKDTWHPLASMNRHTHLPAHTCIICTSYTIYMYIIYSYTHKELFKSTCHQLSSRTVSQTVQTCFTAHTRRQSWKDAIALTPA